MISIRESMTELEKLHALQAAVLENYMAVLRDMEQYAVEINEEITPVYRGHLADIVGALTAQPGVQELATTRSALRGELRDYRDRAAVVLSGLRRDLSEKVEALQAIVEAMASADGDHEERLETAIVGLRKLADTEAAAPVRTPLLDAFRQIEASIEELKRQNSLTVGQFMVEIKTLHKRIETLEMAARKDVLSGLLSRVEMEAQISAAIDRRQAFSLLLLRISNLPLIQRQFGTGVRGDVLGAFAKRMRGGLPDQAVVGRWSEDRFLAMLDIGKSDAIAVAKRLNQHVAGIYVCMENGKPQRPSLLVNMSVIDHLAGGRYESLIARINQL
jgi:GGDEF domain-containing protein